MIQKLSKLGLTQKIVLGMLAGFLVGTIFKFILAGQDERTLVLLGLELPIRAIFVDGLFHIGGEIFLAVLKMLVVPLVFVSLVCGTGSLKDTSNLGRLAGKTIAMYILTTPVAITLAIGLALFVGPGEGLNLTSSANFDPGPGQSLSQIVIDIFPTNPISSMANGNMLQIIVFAILFGLAISLSGKAGERLSSFFSDLNEVIMRLVVLMMNFAPYGVFFLMAKLFTSLGFDTIASLAKYFFLVLFVLALHLFGTYSLMLKAMSGLSPITFFRKMRELVLFAFSTSSSNATIPVTMETVKRLGVQNNVRSFTIPLGATLNMDGTAIMQGVATVFIAQIYGVDLSVSDFLMVILTATLATIGTAGVPGAGLIMLTMVLQQVGLPVEGIALIIGVDRLLDMSRTVVNCIGDAMVSCVVAKSENSFDKDVYYDLKAGLKEEDIDLHNIR